MLSGTCTAWIEGKETNRRTGEEHFHYARHQPLPFKVIGNEPSAGHLVILTPAVRRLLCR